MLLFLFLAPPSFAESQYKATITDKHDSEHTKIVGANEFAPRYPVYAFTPSAPPAN